MNKSDKKHFLAMDRRRFLIGTGALTGTGMLTAATSLQALGSTSGKPENWPQPRRCVFQQMPYVSFDGTGERYEAPAGNKSTRDYLDSISREEYLRRHWFI